MSEFEKKFEIIRKLGAGQFSEVYKVCEKSTGIFYAAKRLVDAFKEPKKVENYLELKVLRNLQKHPNLLELIDWNYEEELGNLTLVFELMDKSLLDLIGERKKCLSEAKCKIYLYQMICGLNHLHQHGIFHRDIKPENILIRIDNRLKISNPNLAEIVKIGDFGSMGFVESRLPHAAYVSTRWYRAPECILTSGYYNAKIDIWAMGCVFAELLTSKPLFPGTDEKDQLTKIHRVLGSPTDCTLSRFKQMDININLPKFVAIGLRKLLPLVSDYGIHILGKMLVYHPDNRYSAQDLLNHIYFQNFNHKLRTQFSTIAVLNTSERKVRPVTKESQKSLQDPKHSQFSTLTSKLSVISKMRNEQDTLEKKMERCWGMNFCPLKKKILNDSIKI